MPASHPGLLDTSALKKLLADCLPPESHPDFDRQQLFNSVLASFSERIDYVEKVSLAAFKILQKVVQEASTEVAAPAAGTPVSPGEPAVAPEGEDEPVDLRPSVPGKTVVTSVKPNSAVVSPPAAVNPPGSNGSV